VNAAAANPNPVTGTSTALSALGSEDGSGSGLTYTWSYTGPTGVTYSGNTNGTNAAQNITANFTQAGSYNFTATITDASNYSTPTSIAVTVNQTVTSIAVNPNTATIGENSNQQFSATAYDQFSNALSSQPTFTWSVTSGIGSVNSSGLYSSPASLGSATVQAASGSVQGSASVTIAAAPTVAQAAAANPSPVTGTSTALSVLGADNGGESNLTYTWSYTGPTGVTYTGNTNGTNAAQNITADFTQPGSYNFTATITDSIGLFTTSTVNVTVQQTATNIVVSPSSTPVVPVGFTQQFSAAATDQFGNSISSPSFGWAITGSGNSIDGTGDATLGSTPGTFTVTASSGSAQGTANVIAENFAVPAGSTLDVNLGTAGPVALSASGGNLTASQNGVQITLSGFTGVTVTDTASSDVLNFNGPVALPFSFVNCGTSTVNVNSGTLTFAAVMGGTIDLGTLFVANGAAAIITAATTQNPTTLDLNSLSIAPNGVLDVTNNEMLIAYGASDPITTIAGYLKSGYDRNGWDGKGIISSMAQPLTDGLRYALGYADGNDGIVSGLASGQIEVKYTLSGDANLDGLVNGSDFNVLSANFNQSITGWDQGDFNYDGLVNASDFNDLSANFNQGVNIAAVANTILAAAPAATTSTPAKTPAAAPVAVSPTSIQTTSTIPASESDDVVDTVLGKHVATKKPRHGGRR
jgi:hypothetical protein